VIPFVFLIVLMVKFLDLNKSAEGLGVEYYLGKEEFPLPPNAEGKFEYYDPEVNREVLGYDAYSQVFFSIGCGVGIW